MLDFDDIKETVSTFFYEKPVLARITLIILCFFLVAMIIIFVQSSPEKQKSYEKNTIILEAAPEIPQGPQIEKDYYQTRNTQSSWTEDEIKKYYTEPDFKMLKELEIANDKIVSDITGAAP